MVCNLDPPRAGANRDAIRSEEAEKYFFHFPDGNASIARLLVRTLIQPAIPQHCPRRDNSARGLCQARRYRF